ncbi:hypothetical protein YPPY45_1539, partial [Yersinia pestis PY-45]
MTCREP